MLSGKNYRLTKTTLGLEKTAQGRRAIEVEAGETITVVYGPKPVDRMLVDVRWRNRTLVMFAEDVEKGGREISVRLAGTR